MADIEWHDRAVAQCLVEHSRQVFHLLEVRATGFAAGAEAVEEFCVERGDYRWVVRELEETEAEGGSGVAARGKDGDELVVDYFAILGEVGEGVEECVLLESFLSSSSELRGRTSSINGCMKSSIFLRFRRNPLLDNRGLIGLQRGKHWC